MEAVAAAVRNPRIRIMCGRDYRFRARAAPTLAAATTAAPATAPAAMSARFTPFPFWVGGASFSEALRAIADAPTRAR